MVALVDLTAAIAAALQPLIASKQLRGVLNGPGDRLNAFPAAWVWFGASNVALDPAQGIYERQTIQDGFVRIYEARRGVLPGDFNRLQAPFDAVKAALNADPTLGGLVAQFAVTGSTEPGEDESFEAVSLDVTWRAVWFEPDTYPTEWS